MKVTVLRFSVALTAAIGVQLAGILIWASICGDASRLITILYRPFFDLTKLFAAHHFGTSDGSLGYYALSGVVFGVLVYSIAVGFLTLLFRRAKSEKTSAHV